MAQEKKEGKMVGVQVKCHTCIKQISETDIAFCQDCVGRLHAKEHGIFRREVFKKYGKKCAECEVTDRRILTIDHIDPDEDRYDVENAQVLCYNHHKLKEIEWLKNNG